MPGIGDILDVAPVIPVLTLEGPKDGVPIARALVAGGLPVLEVTLRTAGALEAVRAIAAEVAGATVGVGTVVAASQFVQAQQAGAGFVVSPGHTADLLAAAEDAGLPYLPGMATVSEALVLAERGYRDLKFFPAEACGGAAFLRALYAPLPRLRFCPTGGIDAGKAAAYLSLPNVPCVGGSWPVPVPAVRSASWGQIESLARAAAALRSAAGPTA
ncbi:MAG: bifunctional 4-hydroxy-2-oxoglutarate aldolase/2-dehydro-3-deoxy-phosphogluconate aldolase [Alphaproteobacteria bacterium]|nr:bifunctional 4-hydroxy-2-oxoglutarate aldolase/2-dehydro-3-deoxy-phosphogluconate aldolase [Alphaproteobacteria bacterium]